jgi:flavodoxin
MKVLVVYYSETSNTERVAESIGEEASRGHETDLKRLEEVKVEDLHGYDFIFFGTPCHDSNLAKPMIRFLEAIPPNPRFSMAGFYTHSVCTRDDQRFERAEELFDEYAAKGLQTFERVGRDKGIDYKGHFNCMGVPNPDMEAFIKSTGLVRNIIRDEDEWAQYIEDVRKHPDSEDLENAKSFARKVLTS